jgi:hypothetical protein
VDLIKESIAADKVWIMRERHGRQRLWAGLWMRWKMYRPVADPYLEPRILVTKRYRGHCQ